ncbi:MAG: DUF1080 domain-containing protein [Sphingobacteriales bacterium]|nr:DUF1080 domain-containing protein [Sphingobacteriales bacterium]NCT73036.1 DUF1080 domain-containing protein [Chitinophagaceae bacterium]OJW30328.1 MAG: large multifunctional protein- glycosyl hydrolase [Sphingobacteriales bacterium 46-32]
MKKLLLLIGITGISCLSFTALQARNTSFADPSPEGRWDITVYDNGREFPSWLEIYHSGHKRLVGQYVGIVGSARPVSIINYKEGVISFTLPPQWEGEDNDLRFEAKFAGDSLTGTMVAANGKTYNWTGHRAPLLRPKTAPVWGKPIKLFNGKDLDGWKALGKTNQWVVENGVLKSPKSGANLITTAEFTDFKLHIEFRCPAGSNSGVYLRGRYEVQIEDSYGKEPQKDYMGAVYGFIKPSEMAAKPAGEWQSYDITLTGRMITVVANGKTIICNQEIPGITGGAINSREGEPGPLLIQGDHGPIEYRNIVITPVK